MSGNTEASIDVRHLREQFSVLRYPICSQRRTLLTIVLPQKISDPSPDDPGKTLVSQSPPPPAEAPPNDVPLVQSSVPSSIPYRAANAQLQNQSRDFSGNLRLSYSIPYSQIDLGETQVDSASMKAINPAQYLPLARDSQEQDQEEGREPTATERDTPIPNTQQQEQEQEPVSTIEDAPMRSHEIMAIAPEEHGEPGPEFGPAADDDIMDEDEQVGKSTHFPESSRFDSPGRQQQSSPAKLDINPLGHLVGMDKGTGMSLADVFNTPSSPVDRTRALGSLPPPTPSYAAARLMAQSMPLAPSVWDHCSSPVWAAGPALRRGTTEPPEFTRASQTDEDRRLAMEVTKTPMRPRTMSPVPFSSPAPLRRPRPVPQDGSDDEDILFSKDELKKMKADARKRKAEAAIKAYRPSESKTVSKKPTKRSKKLARISEKLVGGKTIVQRSFVDDETASDTGPESQCREDGENFATPTTARPLLVVPQTQVPASPPRPRQPPRTKPRQILDFDETWEQLHQMPTLERRSKSCSSLRRNQPPLSGNTLDHTKSMPDISAPLNSGRRGTSANPISLTQMVPYNVPDFPPTPPDPDPTETIAKEVPDFVRESSGLIPLTSQVQSSLTPGPSSPARDDTRGTPPPAAIGSEATKMGNVMSAMAATVPVGDSLLSRTRPPPGMGTPTGDIAPNKEFGSHTKRRRGAHDGADDLSSPSAGAQYQLQSFAALNDSRPPLSSLEDPDEVDMIGIVQDVGIGYRPDLEMPAPPPSILKGRARKKRKTSESGKAKEPFAPVAQIRFSHPSRPPPPAHRAASPAKFTDKAGKAFNPSSKTDVKKRRTSTRLSPALPILSIAPGIFDSDSLIAMATDAEDEPEVPIASIPRPQETSSAVPPVIAPRRVFALFKDQKLQYHPATLFPTESQTQVHVVFDDGTPCYLERHCVRSLDLRLGDTVKVDMPDMKRGAWVISGFSEPTDVAELDKHSDDSAARHTDIRGHLIVSVISKNASASEFEVALTKIYLTKSLWAHYGPRDISANVSVPMSIHNSLRTTASPSQFPYPLGVSIRRTSTPAFINNSPVSLTVAHSKGGLFQGMVFALSFGPEDTMKRSIETKIRAHGGRLLNSGFNELFYDVDVMDGPVRHLIGDGSKQQLVMRPEMQNLGFTAVIAHAHSRRPKFLQALALGLPCLAGRWIDDCVKRGKILDWQYYLLPAGESRYLGGAVKSRMLPLSDAVTARLGDIDSRQRALDGWNVVAVEKGLGADKRVFPPRLDYSIANQ